MEIAFQSRPNLVTYETFKLLYGLEDDLLVADLLDVQAVEIVDGEAEQRLPVHMLVAQDRHVWEHTVVQTWKQRGIRVYGKASIQ